MNNKIKEILDRLDFNEWEVDLYKVPITWCELYNIRDYITNLQNENQRLKELDENYPIEEQLEEALKYENIYKSRIDKAIEYIETNTQNYYVNEPHYRGIELINIEDLLNILQGENNE